MYGLLGYLPQDRKILEMRHALVLWEPRLKGRKAKVCEAQRRAVRLPRLRTCMTAGENQLQQGVLCIPCRDICMCMHMYTYTHKM